MAFSGREEPQGTVGPSLEQVPNQFSYPGDDELPEVRNSQSPDSGRRNGSRSARPRSTRNKQPRDDSYFIRVLVPPDMVGAIIGKGGKKIRDLTDRTGTDITVHKKDDSNEKEKVVEIIGTPDQCTEANLSIHRTMRSETDQADRREDIEMRLLVHGGVAGLVIGKHHCHLAHIADATNVSVQAAKGDYASPRDDYMSQMDRVITISYTLPPESSPVNEDTKLSQLEEDALLKCGEAESRVSERAYACIKNLKQQHCPYPQQFFMQPQQSPWPSMGVHSMSPQPNIPHPAWFQGAMGNSSQAYTHLFKIEVKVHLTFPSKFAGPLIGKQASNLAHIKKFSGVSKVHVLPKDREAPERYIEIIGTPFQQYLAQHCVYCKLAEEGFKTSSGDISGELKLKTEIFIPLRGGSKDQPNVIGRFIGKEGHNVKELQRLTGVRIKVLSNNENTENKEAVIFIEESFASGQRAQFQILDAIVRCQSPPPMKQASYS